MDVVKNFRKREGVNWDATPHEVLN